LTWCWRGDGVVLSLCPGLNNIIREVTNSLLNLYSAEAVYGIVGGYHGFHPNCETPPKMLTREVARPSPSPSP
jgi:6-phosphofructokinase